MIPRKYSIITRNKMTGLNETEYARRFGIPFQIYHDDTWQYVNKEEK